MSKLTDLDIQDFAYEAGLHSDGVPDTWDNEAILRFARLIEANRIEAAAKECDEWERYYGAYEPDRGAAASLCADSVRKLGRA
jgi:hypothetical protein